MEVGIALRVVDLGEGTEVGAPLPGDQCTGEGRAHDRRHQHLHEVVVPETHRTGFGFAEPPIERVRAGVGDAEHLPVSAQRSAGDSVLQLHDSLVGRADLQVRSSFSHAGLADDLPERIEQVDGVVAAVPMIHTAVFANDPEGDERVLTALGVDCRVGALTELVPCEGEAIAGTEGLGQFDGIAVSTLLRAELGDRGVVRTNAGRISLSDAVAIEALDEINDGQVVVASLDRAQELFTRPDAVDSIFVVLDPGADLAAVQVDIQSTVGDWHVVSPAGGIFRGADSFTPITAGLTIVGLLGLAIGGQLVFNAVSLSLEERRREAATLSAVGGRPFAVAAVVLAEATVLGLAGGVLGVAGARYIEGRLMGGLDRVVSEVSGVQLVSNPSAMAIVWCLVAGVAVAVIAAVRPALTASRLELGSELSAGVAATETEERLRPTKTLVWWSVAFVGGGLAWLGGRDGSLDSWQPPAALGGAFLTIFAVARASGLSGPLLLDGVRRVAGPRLEGRSSVVIARLVRQPARTAAMTLAVASAVSMGMVLAGFRAGMEDAGAELTRSYLDGRVLASTTRAENTVFVASRPSPELIEALLDQPSVGAVHEHKVVEVDLPSGADVLVRNRAEGTRFDVYDGDADAAYDRGEVMIGPALARHLDADAGDSIRAPGRDGFHDLVVRGVWAAPSNQGFSITTSEAILEEIWGTQPPIELHITPAPGVSVSQLADALRGSGLDPDLRILTPDELAREYADTWSDYLGPFASLQQAMVLMAMVAVASTLLLAGVQRRREDGVLAAVGSDGRGLAGLAMGEAIAISAVGIVAGTASGMVMMASMVHASQLVTGLTIPFHVATVGVITSGITLLIAVGVVSLLPAWRVSRLDVVEALQYE